VIILAAVFSLATFLARSLVHPTIEACSLNDSGAVVQHWRWVNSSRNLCGFLRRLQDLFSFSFEEKDPVYKLKGISSPFCFLTYGEFCD